MQNNHVKRVVKRRNFFGSFAALGAVLFGFVPELRSQAHANSGGQADAVPLAPSVASTLFSQAAADADVKILLSEIESSASLGVPEYSYDLGSQGRILAIPVKSGTESPLAYLLFGTISRVGPSGAPEFWPLKIALKKSGAITMGYIGKIYHAPPEVKDSSLILHAAFFRQQFIEARVGAFAQQHAKAQDQRGPAVAAAAAVCLKQYNDCLELANIKPGIMVIGWIGACLACSMGVLVQLPAAPATGGGTLVTAGTLAVRCSLLCGGLIAHIANYIKAIQNCDSDYKACLALPPPPRPVAGPKVRPIGGPGEVPDVNI